MKTDKQLSNSKAPQLAPFQWKKGQSGNPKGRPKGKTMKEYARELLICQTEDERQEFLQGLSKDIIWKMAEGLPQQGMDIKHEIKDSLTEEQINEILNRRSAKDNASREV